MNIENVSENFNFTITYDVKNIDKLNGGIKLYDKSNNLININNVKELTELINLLQSTRLYIR